MNDEIIRPFPAAPIRLDKYYDLRECRLLTINDFCPVGEWGVGGESAKIAVHPRGFPIFLSPSEIALADEYRDRDPYGVMDETGEPTAFHERRFQCTVHLLKGVAGDSQHETRILDVGCGRGYITAEIAARFPSAEVSGVDRSVSAIIAAKTHHPSIDFAVADAYALPYVPSYFNVVVCNNIWEHVPDPLRLLRSVDRILAPDGHVIISTPSRYRLGNLMRAFLGRPMKLISRHHVTEYSVGQVIEQLRFGGFEAQVFDRQLRLRASGISGLLLRKLLGPCVRTYLRLVRSHHSLEWTVFYLARRVRNN